MKVEELMTRAVRTCRSDDTLNEAARIMWEQDVGALPVINAAGEPVAMITDRDICMAAFTQGQPLAHMLVQTAMSRGIHTCRRSEALSAAEHTMQTHQVRRLPVVDDLGRIAGILSLGDLARARSGSTLGRADQRFAGDVRSTLAAICEQRSPQEPLARNRPNRDSEPNPQQPRIRPPKLTDALSYFRS